MLIKMCICTFMCGFSQACVCTTRKT